MPNSIAGSPSSADAAFDFVARMAVNPVTGTLFVTNNSSGVYRADSQDITASFPRVLGSLSAHQYSEVAAGPDGRLVATLSTLNTSGGQSAAGRVYLSEAAGGERRRFAETQQITLLRQSFKTISLDNQGEAF